ncbi:hypothetical protein GDO81_001069 [Engystomops pustulosus]|uniref:Uncharacterized protein n=1 Tax=Engystomops pustulosus TaxID=76066 RepID=A0AAV7D9G2_ENGPU|nr:hypothetical protein GDO81_001069 [Engystomops pustulosus]
MIKKAESIIGVKMEQWEDRLRPCVLQKFPRILIDQSHPLYNRLEGQRSAFSGRLKEIRCVMDRYKKSFVPILSICPSETGWFRQC